MKKNLYEIDDITWNDLSMEDVYQKLNTAKSSVGQEFLKKLLHSTILEEAPLKQRSDRALYLSEHPEKKKAFQKIFTELGISKKLSLYDYIFRFHEIKPASNALHYLLILLLCIAIALIFINPVIGVLALVVMFSVNIGTYFKAKASIEGYFLCFKYIVRMLRAASSLVKLTDQEGQPFYELSRTLKKDIQILAPMKRGSWLLTNSISGSLVDVVMDYVRMLFHVDIIKFNQMRKLAADKTECIDELFCTLGEIEADCCISSYRESLEGWCEPHFTPQEGSVISNASSQGLKLGLQNLYHPLTEHPVKNSLDTGKSVLLTGSNASGKSTFLKQVAINQIFAQTIYTCLADRYETGFFKVLSSMALTDNILGKESYFIVEIKSLKRIFDALEPEIPVLCFVDEVLRGTNTKERVAASSQILKVLSHSNALCFAATHDIELTELLQMDMNNYHFEEQVVGNDVRFDYQLKSGPATTRNAILLMESYGFDPEIIQGARALVEQL